MSVLFMTIAFSFIIALVFLFGFFWSVKSGQFEDTDGPAVRMLFDDKKTTHATNNNKS
ncbi:MAG: cbb3-type cytochrome oxidase assembly protein CcoS [Bacteroidia bacterium]|jgi:cbb3-type cytochrome oxidase maturation protein